MKKFYFLVIPLVVLVVLGISFFTKNSASKITYNCQKDKTAFELLQKSQGDVQFEESEFGRLVTAVKGVKQGHGKYWLYSVNGKIGTVSASMYYCQDQEEISWELK